MQPALQRAALSQPGLFILQIYYWRGVTTNYPTLSLLLSLSLTVWRPFPARCFISSLAFRMTPFAASPLLSPPWKSEG